MKKTLSLFIRGLLFVAPIFITIYVLYNTIKYIDGLLDLGIPGLGILVVLLGITAIGYFVQLFITKPLFDYFERVLSRLPLVKIIYTAIKELLEAFVGDQKKFNVPVLISFPNDMKRLGFVTNTDLEVLGLKDYVSVYCPHSYNFSGNMYLFPTSQVKELDLNSADIMKFVVSAGATTINDKTEELK
jgi:uncharacterized membrane protein